MEIVRYLLQKGADVDAECRWNRTPLMEAIKTGHTNMVRLLLKWGADWRPKVDVEGMDFVQDDTALSLAKRTGNAEIVRMLKRAGARK